MSRPWLVITLVIYGVLASMSMIVLGWPEDTPAQIALLELAPLPLQAALVVGLWHLSRRMRPLGQLGRAVWWIALALTVAGLVLVGVAYLGPRGLLHPGLAVVWVGLLLAMVLVVGHLPRRQVRELFRVIPDEDEEEAGIDLLDEAEDDLADEAGEAPEHTGHDETDSADPGQPSAPGNGPTGSIESRRD